MVRGSGKYREPQDFVKDCGGAIPWPGGRGAGTGPFFQTGQKRRKIWGTLVVKNLTFFIASK
jgi:hypothetical protein